jgi:hypothetical protein
VSDGKTQRIGFPLRLAASLKDRAKLLATRDGVSLNHFINLAVAEKVSRLEVAIVQEDFSHKHPTAPVNNVMRPRRSTQMMSDNHRERRN